MARRSIVQEIRAISSPKDEGIFAYSDSWEAWEMVGEDEDDPESWEFVADGLLESCMEALLPIISIEVDMAMGQEKQAGMQCKGFFEEMSRRREQKQEEIRRMCLQKGEYQGQGWVLRSILNRSQCTWKKKQEQAN